jgi:hypothetical protein
MTMRNLARASAAGILAAGALALAATPALAVADVDLGISLKGTTIAAGAKGKPATLSLTNHGTTKPTEVGIRFDGSKLDLSRITLDLGECTYVGGVADCTLDRSAIPGPGLTADLAVQLVKTGTGNGSDAGSLTITIFVKGDTNKKNDTATAKITLTESHGADFRVLAYDVTAVKDGQLSGKPIPPGGSSFVFGSFANHGDYDVRGVKVTVKLPKYVAFTQEQACAYSADKRTATCITEDVAVLPWDFYDDGNADSSFGVYLSVKVAKDAKGPVSLAGGTVTATALSVREPTLSRSRVAPAELPDFARKLTAAELAKLDVDASDNTDGFAVLVAGPAGGTGGGDGGPILPVTGPVAASIGAAGAVALALGAFLFVSARRRRIVLVAPADGK